MKNIRIIGYYTTPRHHFGLAAPLLNLIETTVNTEILAKYTFTKVNSKVLEIMLDTEVETNKRRIKQLSKTGRGQYFSFAFCLPYHVIVQNDEVNIAVFINEFMEAIREALSQFKIIPDSIIENLKKQLIAKTEGKKEYVYVMPKQLKDFYNIADEVSREFKAGELVAE